MRRVLAGCARCGKVQNMKTLIIVIIVALLVAMLLLKTAGRVSVRDARGHLQNGALVIDVRSSSEFASGHLPNAVNFPLADIKTSLPLRVGDKNRILLLHCQSGMRSSIAVEKLKSAGYTRVYNLGSLSRAREIVEMAEKE